MHKTISEKRSGIRGQVTFTTIPVNTREAELLDEQLGKGLIKGDEFFAKLSEIQNLGGCKSKTWKNQVVLSGRSIIARLLGGDTTYTGEINYGALGSGSTAINDSDVALDTEVSRKARAHVARTNDSTTMYFYFSKADTNGTYEEFGTFIDGTGTTDSGQMFNRVLTGGWTKTASEALTVAVQFDVDAA